MGSAASPSSQTRFSVVPMVTEARKTSVHLRLPHSSCYNIWHDGFPLEDCQRWNSDVIRGPQKAQADWRLLNIRQSEFILIPWCIRYLSHCWNNMLTLKKEGLIWLIVWENNPSWEGSHSSLCLRQWVSSHPWSRIRDQLMVSQLSPLYSVQNPSSWNGAVHICSRSLYIN